MSAFLRRVGRVKGTDSRGNGRLCRTFLKIMTRITAISLLVSEFFINSVKELLNFDSLLSTLSRKWNACRNR